MALTDFIPAKEADLLAWSDNFNTGINAAPLTLGLTVLQGTNYSALHVTFATDLAATMSPSTRTPSSLVAKDISKKALIANARLLAGIIQKCPTVSDVQRTDLRLTVKSGPSPVPVPADPPQLTVKSVVGNTATITLRTVGAGSTRRGKPAGVVGATVCSFVGATPPSEIALWKLEGNVSKTEFEVLFDAGLAPGTRVWLCAFWFNEKMQSSPTCAAVGANLQGGGIGGPAMMEIAA